MFAARIACLRVAATISTRSGLGSPPWAAASRATLRMLARLSFGPVVGSAVAGLAAGALRAGAAPQACTAAKIWLGADHCAQTTPGAVFSRYWLGKPGYAAPSGAHQFSGPL